MPILSGARFRGIGVTLAITIAFAMGCPSLSHAGGSHTGLQWDKPVSYTPSVLTPKSKAPNAKVTKTNNGHVQFQKGLNYFMGKGVPKDRAMAVMMWRSAAIEGNTDAQSCLGYLYYTGIVVARSYKEAAKWYRKAAEAGAADAQHNLGVMYYQGQGVQKDNVRAMAWFMVSSQSGYQRAMAELRYVEGGSSPDQIAMARKIAMGRLAGR